MNGVSNTVLEKPTALKLEPIEDFSPFREFPRERRRQEDAFILWIFLSI